MGAGVCVCEVGGGREKESMCVRWGTLRVSDLILNTVPTFDARSLATLLRRAEDHWLQRRHANPACLVLIKTLPTKASASALFGFYSTHWPRMSPPRPDQAAGDAFLGNGDGFLFVLEPRPRKYGWRLRGGDRHFLMCRPHCLAFGGAAVCVDQALEGGTSAASTTFSNTSSILDFSQVSGARMPQLNLSPYILNSNETLSTPGVRGA